LKYCKIGTSVASRISKLWGIVPLSTEKCGGFEKMWGAYIYLTI
jgi:hypothetical protein